MKIAQPIIDKVLVMNSQGLATKAIAKKLKISPKSVRRFVLKAKLEEVSIKEDIISKDEKVLNFTLENNSKHLDKILKERGYDPKDWTIKNIYHNEWQSQKAKNQGLVTLYQFKVHLVRKDSEIVTGNISINISNTLKTQAVKRKFKKAVIIPDIQCGFRRDLITGQLRPIHDRIALATALALTKEINPDRIIFLGDNLDLAEMSIKYTASPDFYFTSQASIVELAWWLGKFRQINPSIQIDYIEGNHDHRASSLLLNKALAFSGLKLANDLTGPDVVSIERLLGLDKLNINYSGPYPTGVVKINKNLICIHGTVAKGESGATVSTVVKDARVSVIQGHIHRYEVATKTVWDANNDYYMYTAASFGCLCSLEPGMVPGMKHLQNWQQGIGLVTYEDVGNEEFRQEFIPIIKGRSLFNDKEFIPTEESQIINSIEKDTKFKVS